MIKWKTNLKVLYFVLIILNFSHPASAQTRSITMGYSQFFQTTNKHSYYGREIGGKSIGYGLHVAHTSTNERYFINTNFGYTWSHDSIVISSGNAPPHKGVQQLNVMDIGINFGIGHTLQFNSFLGLYLGGGLHYARITYDYAGIAVQANPGVTTELLGCARYEFEHFYVVATYSYMFTINERDILTHRNGFRLGISIPYRRE